MKTMFLPCHHHDGFVATHAPCHMICRGSLISTYILYINIHILYIYIYIYLNLKPQKFEMCKH